MSSNFDEKDNMNIEAKESTPSELDTKVVAEEESKDEFDELSVIDISSDVEYQLNQERTGIEVVKLEANKSTRKLNGFDLFFIRLWAAIVSFITFISSGISRGFKKVFKKELPEKYVTVFISALLIILLIIIILAPFNLTVGEKKEVDIFSNSMMPVSRVNSAGTLLWGYVDKQGREVIDCKYYDAEPFYNGVAFVMDTPESWILIGTNGKKKEGLSIKINSSNLDLDLVGDFNNSSKRAWIYENGAYTYINTSGKKVSEYYDKAEDFSNGYGLVKKGNSWFFINSKGKQKSPEYIGAKSFSEGLAAVKKNTGWTFVNDKFEEITEDHFDAVTSFKEGYAWIRIGSAVNLIDKKGKTIIPTGFNGMKPSDEVLRELGFEL